jgi:kumamolisin
MTSQSERVPLAGSLRRRTPKGVVRNEPPAGDFLVRVMVRPQKARPSLEELGRQKTRDRKYLTRDEHDKLYGANPEDLKKVEAFAAKHGLTVVSSNAAQRTVLLSGPPAAFSEAFGVQLITCVVKGHPIRCRADKILIPKDLEGIITSVTGLDERPVAVPHFRVTRRESVHAAPAARPAAEGAAAASEAAATDAVAAGAATRAGEAATPAAGTTAAGVAKGAATAPAAGAAGITVAAPAVGGAVTHNVAFPTGFSPSQVAVLYDFPHATDGTGQTIAILELGGGFRPDELNTYFNQAGIHAPNVITQAYPNGGPNTPGTDPLDPANADVEVMLDIQVAGSVAPGAKIVVYFAPDASEQSFLGAINAIVHDSVNNPTVVSISWGGPEDGSTDQFKNEFDTILQSAAQLGMTVCVASGDDGSADFASNDPNWDGNAHVDFPASDPYVLACGGTQLTAADGQITKEVTWNEGANDGSGGGVSRFFQIPSYQQNAGVPAAAAPPGPVMRGVPDVAGNAAEATGYQILCDGQKFPDASKGIPPVGGTSAVAPLWAGLIACINQSLGNPVGFVNPLLYAIPAAAGAFHDITEGTNGVYNAKAGWDPCTGLGSPDGQKLLQAL